MMQARTRLWAIWRTVAAALLLVVTAHAAAPPAEALSRTAGSAFSAATADVSLKSRGKIVLIREDRQIEPPRPVEAVPTLVSVAPTVTRRFHSRPPTRGPPVAATSFSPLSPRAPPSV